jgi:hypothetical protein
VVPADVPTTLARRAWTLYEPIHAIVYFVPESAEHYSAAGLRGGWMGYFASRSAAMGAVSADVVTAVFHNFRPQMVARAIPDAWRFSSPERVLEARRSVADAALRRLWGAAVDSPDVAEAAALAREVAAGLRGDGRPLYAAHAGLPVPDAPHLQLWHACTLLREHRFDGHIAALTVSGLSGLEALVTARAAGPGMDTATIQRMRGWTETECDDAAQGLRARGILDADIRLTAEGRALRDAVEETTDRLAEEVWEADDQARRERLFGLLLRLTVLLERPDGIRYPNPIGVGRPS